MASLACATFAHAHADLAVTIDGPAYVRLLPGSSTFVGVRVSNLGPDDASTATLAAPIFSIWGGYHIALPPPNCGELTETSGIGGVGYRVVLGDLQNGQEVTCSFEITRDTTDYAASDLPLNWNVASADDINAMNDYAVIAIGSLIDVGIHLETLSFNIDPEGIAHEAVLLHVLNRGPSAVSAFTVGACMDFGYPGFAIDGDFAGGCGPLNYGPSCFEVGMGLLVPQLSPDKGYSCSLQLTTFTPYTAPILFGIYTDSLTNPATLGGTLLDIFPDDNATNLTIAADPIFANGFEPSAQSFKDARG